MSDSFKKSVIDVTVAELMIEGVENRDKMLKQLLTRMIAGEQVTLIEQNMMDGKTIKYQYMFVEEELKINKPPAGMLEFKKAGELWVIMNKNGGIATFNRPVSSGMEAIPLAFDNEHDCKKFIDDLGIVAVDGDKKPDYQNV